ncbi:MAG: magnesium transporter, partial [Xanthomarina gelatinilytica]|nr:magnesium transporter [Xanthomarina gelatinilytica]
MSEEKENIQFELTDELIEQVEQLIETKNDKELQQLLKGFHYADIAEILDEVNLEEAMYVIKLLDSETT